MHSNAKYRVATLPGIWQFRKKIPGKNWNLGNFVKYLEKPGILTIFTCLVVKFRFGTKNLSYR